MSVADQESPAPSLRRLPFTVRLSPQLVNQLSTKRNRPNAPGDISGLLFGLVEGGTVIGQALGKFDGETGVSGSAERASQDKVFQQQITLAQKTAATASLDLIGWYAIRESGGLSASDLTYHDWYFPRPNDLALILKPEGASGFSLEIYCRTVNGVLSEAGHRVGLVRLSASPVESPVEVVPRPKIQDDFFMRAYEIGDAAEEKGKGWKGTLAVRYPKAFSFLRGGSDGPARPDTANLHGEPVPEALLGKESAKPPSLAAASHNPPSLQPTAQISSSQASQAISRAAQEVVPAQKVFDEPETARPTQMAPASYALTIDSSNVVSSTPSKAVSATAGLVTFNEPARLRPIWPTVLAVFLVTSGLTFGVVYILQTSDKLPRILQMFSAQTPLGLKVESQGDRLLVTWNRQHQLVQHARTGTLLIEDGQQRREVALDAPHVAYGSILYHAHSDDVTFRLEVHGANGEQAIESIRVLESSKSDASTPEPLQLSPVTPAGSVGDAKQPAAFDDRPNLSRPTRPVATKPENSSSRLQQMADPATTASHAGTDELRDRTGKPAGRADEEVQATPDEAQILKAPPSTDQGNVPVTGNPAPALRTPPPPVPAATSPAEPELQFAKPPVAIPSSPGANPPNYQPPRPTRQVLPNVSLLPPGVLARISQLEVVVKLDEQGRVTDVTPVENGKRLNQALLGSAILAARQWRFEPATLRGKAIPSQHSIVFQFAPRTP